MIDLFFTRTNEIILVRIQGNSILFGNTKYGAKLAPIDGLKLDYSGVIGKFPDLKDDPSWREKAIIRFKEYIASLKTENEKANYIIKELNRIGYTPKLKQVQGMRPIKITCQ